MRSGAAATMILSKGCVIGPAGVAVADAHLDIAAALSGQTLPGVNGQIFDQFDAVHMARQRCQDRRLITQPGADFEHVVGRLQLEQIGHQGNDERLRDRLAAAAGQGHVVVGKGLQLAAHKVMAWHLGHDIQNAPVE